MPKYVVGAMPSSGKIIGKKADNLFRLQRQGFAVPKFFCVPARCLSDHLRTHQAEINALLRLEGLSDESLKETSRHLGEIIAGLRVDALSSELGQHLKANFRTGTRFSVRSSASAEDSDEASFAGIFDTQLNVPAGAVTKYVQRCWMSLYGRAALQYCRDRQLDPRKLAMGVVVQEMVEADMAGVVFSANPQGLLNEVVTVVGPNLGENVADDKAAASTYYFNTADERSYSEQPPGAPRLEPAAFDELMAVTKRATRVFGPFIDLEFAVKAEKVYLLQVRSITTIDDRHVTVLDNSNIVESYPGITLPLTESFIKEAYHQVFRRMMVRGMGGAAVQKHEPLLREMVESVNGRVYYRISNWYSLMQFLPFSKRILPVWQEMMGVHHKEQVIAPEYLKTPDPLRDMGIYARALYLTFALPGQMKRLNDDFLAAQRFFNRRYRRGMSARQALSLYHKLSNLVLKDWDLTLSNDVYAFASTGLLKSRLRRLGVPDAGANQYVGGLGKLDSLEPIRGLVALAQTVVKDGLGHELGALKDDAALERYLSSNRSGFAAQFRDFVEQYGDRSLEELKLESKTFRSSPITLVRTVLEYALDPRKLDAVGASLPPETRERPALREIEAAGIWDRWLVERLRSRAAAGIANREQSRLNRSRIYGMVRSLFLTIGERWREDGRLERPDDVFYLRVEEIKAGVRDPGRDFKAEVQQRRAEYTMYDRLPAYSRLVFAGEPFNKRPQFIYAAPVAKVAGKLTGTPTSRGAAEGEVVVVNDPKDAGDVKDKILVAKTTDPGWVFLLAVAKGIIAEKGSLLSHTAIIARELGTPAVVGVKDATRQLHNGERVRLDGNRGVVERLDGAKETIPDV